MKTRRVVSAFAFVIAIAAGAARFDSHAAATSLRVLLSVPASQTTAALDGRMLLLVSTDQRTEPRFQVSDNDRTAQIFGVDVEGLKPGQDAIVHAGVLGYPVQSLSDIKAGDYWVQGLLHVYETFKRSDGQPSSFRQIAAKDSSGRARQAISIARRRRFESTPPAIGRCAFRSTGKSRRSRTCPTRST